MSSLIVLSLVTLAVQSRFIFALCFQLLNYHAFQVATLGPGDYLGEGALLRDEPRNASITDAPLVWNFAWQAAS